MYLAHFKLTRKPFEVIPDPGFLHMSKKHRLALNLLEYGVYEQSGFTVISGEVGCGKTTLVQHLLNTMDNEKLVVGLINNTHESLGDLNQWIALALNIPTDDASPATLFKKIQQHIIRKYARGKRVLLIVDEAQNLSPGSLEQLRLYSNINSNTDFLLQILLVGQPQLTERLLDPSLAQIAQRVSVEYHLEPLDLEETLQYVRHRLAVAGAEYPIFDETAVSAIYYHSGGIPRLINTLSDFALVHAYAKDDLHVSFETALEVISSRRIVGARSQTTKEKIRLEIIEAFDLDLGDPNINRLRHVEV